MAEGAKKHRACSTRDNAGRREDAAAVTTPTEPNAPLPGAAADADLVGRLREAASLLEAAANDASLLDSLKPDERARFQRALASAFHPDRKARRKRLKAAEKAGKR